MRGRSPCKDCVCDRRRRGDRERGVSPSDEGKVRGQRPCNKPNPGKTARERFCMGERVRARSRRGVRWGRRASGASHGRWLRGVCASISCGTRATHVRRVAYGEGEGRSRSGPTSIHSGVSRMLPLTQERRCMLCREDLRVWDSTVVPCRV